jgi:TonB family protein
MLIDSSVRNFGDLDIAHAQVVAPAPKLTVAEQRLPSSGKPSLGNASVVPPSPSVEAGAAARSGGNLIALGIHPAPPNASVEAPAGNRRGTFAATPDGKSGAPGTPAGAAVQDQSSTGSGQPRSGLPSGLVVGAGPKPATSPAADTRLTADATTPRVSSVPHPAETSKNAPTEVEKQVFGDRKFYSMTLNMPNLNSAGGSWVIHFAELKGNAEKGDLSTPVPTHEVDPGYPIELMRQNVHGTVTLYAVIHSDGSVGTVRVLSGIDDRLDEYARAALSRWKFQPATKNGSAIDLEAVVTIPFRLVKGRSGF